MNENEITARIAAANQGSAERDKALNLVYDDLLRIARAELARHRRGDTLNTRALVNEAYLKLFDRNEGQYENRKHFFATAARRDAPGGHRLRAFASGRTPRRGAEHVELEALEGMPLPVDEQAEQLVGMDRALEKLAKLECASRYRGRDAFLRRTGSEGHRRTARRVRADDQARYARRQGVLQKELALGN